VWTSEHAWTFDCDWSGFPNVVTTEQTVLSFVASAEIDYIVPKTGKSVFDGNVVFIVGETGATVPLASVSAPYSGTYQVVLPAGTNLSTVFIEGSVYAGTGDVGYDEGNIAQFSISNIVIAPQ
jgi:hypothetical protein